MADPVTHAFVPCDIPGGLCGAILKHETSKGGEWLACLRLESDPVHAQVEQGVDKATGSDYSVCVQVYGQHGDGRWYRRDYVDREIARAQAEGAREERERIVRIAEDWASRMPTGALNALLANFAREIERGEDE